MTSAMPAGRNGVSSWLWQLKCTRPPAVPQQIDSRLLCCDVGQGIVLAGDSFGTGCNAQPASLHRQHSEQNTGILQTAAYSLVQSEHNLPKCP